MELFARLVIEGLRTGSLYAIIAVGFSLIWWVTGTVHIAHGGVLLVAAYVVFALVTMANLTPAAAILAAGVVAVLLGLTLETSLYKPLRRKGAGELTILTASFGTLIVMEHVLAMVFGQDIRMLEAEFLREPLVTVGGIGIDAYTTLTFLTAAVVFAGVVLFMTKSRTGKGLRALAANDELSRVVGLNVERLRSACVVLGSLMIVPASVLILYDTGVVPELGLHFVLLATVVTIFGGIGGIVAALVGGLVVGLAESLMVWRFTAGWQDVVTFAILYVVLLFRPQGLFGAPASNA